jgi:hypothetical protein
MMNIGQWSGAIYSPVNLYFDLKEWVEKPVNEKKHFKKIIKKIMLPF